MELQDQLLLEEDLVLQGIDRYTKGTASAQEQGRSADTGYGQRLVTTLIKPVAQGINEFKTDGVRKYGKYKTLLKDLDDTTIAYIALKTVLNKLHAERTVAQVAVEIGLHIEDEQRFAAFKELNPAYYSVVMKDFSKKNTKAYRHMRNVLAVTSKKKGLDWNNWTTDTRLAVGSALLDQILKHTDLIQVIKRKLKGKKVSLVIVPTEEAIKWISGYNDYASLLHPYTKPCIVPPDDWTGLHSGGYWSEAMRHRNPFIKGLSASEQKFIEDHDMTRVYRAVNTMQKVPWEINTSVLEVMKDVWASKNPVGLPNKEPVNIPKFKVDTPPKEMDTETFQEFLKWKGEVAQMYTDEISRSSKAFEVSRVISMAQSYTQYDKLWFVYQCDFRGRVYASSSGLSPQGADYNRSLLRFREGKLLGENGLYWLAVHGANCFGVDKVSFDDRVDWIMEKIDLINYTKHDPQDAAAFWGEADYPYMFLAFCLEFAEAVKNPDEFISHLPVGMDGSCNGLQNFSALLRDEIGGAATNLTPSDKPADIYQTVADRALERITEGEECDSRTEWLAFAEKHGGISRKIAKRPVMTLPYGCTKYSCLSFVNDALREIDAEFFEDINKACSYFTDVLWESISDVVVAASEAMQWLQSIASLTADKNLPIWWVNPIGFPVYQAVKQVSSYQVRTMLLGGTRLRLNKKLDSLSKSKQIQGIAPNFVHSLDSAHMMLTLNAAEEMGISSFSMIHDDFGTHACDVEQFRYIIKDSFVNMYKQNNPLDDLYLTVSLVTDDGEVPPTPDRGTLSLDGIKESEYFFA